MKKNINREALFARPPGRRLRFAAALALVTLFFFSLRPAAAQSLQDYFTNRLTITNLTGEITQNNSNATVEAGEPLHGGKPGGHSLWISWVARSNGIVTFKTETSGFDTLLSAYQFTATNGTTFADLREVARADDSEGLGFESQIEFGVRAGERYEIAVDGYFGATGQVDFQWATQTLPAPPPQIVSTLQSRSANVGDAVTMSFAVTNAGAGTYKWFLNDDEISGLLSTNLTIASFAAINVGRYKMRVSVSGGIFYYSVPFELQLNSDGSTNTLAEDKLLDAPFTPLVGSDGSTNSGHAILAKVAIRPGGLGGGTIAPRLGVVRGYNGSQVFNTTFATTDPSEPPHCGVTGGASYWLQYSPPTNGTMTLDTIGSSYDTVMEVYTYNGTLTSYTNLISIACDNDSVSSNGPSRVMFQAVKARPYIIVVDGVNAARGTAWLNYALNTNAPAQPPAAASLVVTQTVFVGANLTLAPSITGALPLVYAWKKNGTNIAGVTIPFLQLTNVTSANTATYTLTVTNDLGAITVSNIVHVVTPMNISVDNNSSSLNLTFPTTANFRYTIQQATNVVGPWTPWSAPFIGGGENYSTNIAGPGTKFFRVKIE